MCECLCICVWLFVSVWWCCVQLWAQKSDVRLLLGAGVDVQTCQDLMLCLLKISWDLLPTCQQEVLN